MRLLITFLFFMTVLVTAQQSPLLKRSAYYESMAARSNRSTVGIYCNTSQYMSFYGTGVIISQDGYILTSTTVVPPGAEDIRIHLSNHKHYPAELVEIKPDVESALLKINTEFPLPCIPVAGNYPAIGERAYTLGNAHNMIRLGEQASFSVGSISGIYQVKSIDTQSSYEGLAIETDAAINPGQDGGPLLNSHGQLVGIVSLSYSDARWQGVAVPIKRIMEEVDALRNDVVRICTGQLMAPLPGDSARARGLAGHARGYAQSLARIHVTRKYPPEKMQRKVLNDYLQSVEGFIDMNDEVRAEIVSLFYRVDETLATNQQIRRPDSPVSGIVISPDGYILTSMFNVAEDEVWVHKEKGLFLPDFNLDMAKLTAFNENDYKRVPNQVESITVTLPDGSTHEAKLIAKHYPTAIALLKVEAKKLAYIDINRRSAAPKIGQACGVVGSVDDAIPYTLNTGMISAEERYRNQRFQFDAIINYGNSGGPVITADGELLGIAIAPMYPGPTMGRIYGNTSILRWSIAPNSGVSFGARIDKILEAMPSMMEGKSTRLLGGAFIGVAPDPKRLLDKVVKIDFVQPGSAADKAGIRKGDIVLSFNDKRVYSWKDVTDEIDLLAPGDLVKVRIKREGRQRYLKVDGMRIEDGKDLKELMQDLTNGEKIIAEYVDTTDEELLLELEVGERK